MEPINQHPARKLKVVWICHLSNEWLSSNLHLKSNYHTEEFAPWISDTAKLFEASLEIELFIVFPHNGLLRIYEKFRSNGITYFAFKSDIPLIHCKLCRFPVYLNRFVNDKYLFNKLAVKLIVNRIKPDIIHLHGAENPRYSSAITQFHGKYPVLITIQGFASLSKITGNRALDYAKYIEQSIIRSFTHFGIRTETMGRDVHRFKPQAKLLWHGYAMKEIRHHDLKEIYDLVFFARVCKDKGIEDLIVALSKIKTSRPDTSLAIIGSGDKQYLEFLHKLALQHGVAENVNWLGFQPTQADVHKLASQSKVCVLPTYHDIISGTIVESMKLGIPVVAYRTGSIPELNQDDTLVELVEQGDIEELANKILLLLDNPEYANTLSQKAQKYADIRFGNQEIANEIVSCYHQVIKDFDNQRNNKK